MYAGLGVHAAAIGVTLAWLRARRELPTLAALDGDFDRLRLERSEKRPEDRGLHPEPARDPVERRRAVGPKEPANELAPRFLRIHARPCAAPLVCAYERHVLP